MASLFGQLAPQFTTQVENVATAALGYILSASPNARAGFVKSLSGAVKLDGDLQFSNQVSLDAKARPDLAGSDTGNTPYRLFVEAKFWAGFTENQPVGYLQNKELLPDGVLVVICPSTRIPYVWNELVRRLRDAGLAHTASEVQGEFAHAVVGDKRLILQSWQRTLNAIQFEVAHEPERLADLAQLAGLCERMDADAFIPVTSEELTSSLYRRVGEFVDIVDAVVGKLVHDGVADIKGLKAAAQIYGYRRYMHLSGDQAALEVNHRNWGRLGPSPIWLVVWHRPTDFVYRLLADFALANPGSIQKSNEGCPMIMLRVPLGAERDAVIKSLYKQVCELGELLAPLAKKAGEQSLPTADAKQGSEG